MASLLSIGLGLIVVAFQINLTILSHIRFSRLYQLTEVKKNHHHHHHHHIII